MLVACAQSGWPGSTPEQQVLAEIAHAGYAGAPAFQRAGRSAEETVRLYAQHLLFPAPGDLRADFWLAGGREALLAEARRCVMFARDVGSNALYLVPGGFVQYVGLRGKHRSQLVGRIQPEDGLNSAEWRRFADVLNRIGEIAARESVSCCLQNHAGSVIETQRELEKVLSLTDPALVSLCPDTGHLAWGGCEPVAFCRQHAARIGGLQLRDVDAEVLQRGRERAWDYDAFLKAGLFTALGQGCLDTAALLAGLQEAGFSGWIVVESDVQQRADPFQCAALAREYLRSLGV
jgi:inosose dehydratase